MSEREYMDADYEVIDMVNRGHGSRLPSKTLTFIPTERVEYMEALDARIQKLQRIMPIVGPIVIAVVSLLIGLAL